MKVIALALALLGAVAFAAVEDESEFVLEDYNQARFRREADPQGSIVIQGQKPLSGPDRRPSLDVDYNHRVFDRNGATGSAYGGLNIQPGQPAQPHIGFKAEREFKNGFVNGFGQVQRGPGGRPSPSFGVNGGFRFRRETKPRGSVVIQAQKPQSGPDRRPSLDVDYNHRVFDRNGATGSAYGGLNIRPGQPAQSHIGFKAEREFKNGFVNGFGQVQRGPGGRPSPSFGVNAGFRFRREANPQGSIVLQGQKPLSGPDRRPSLDVDYNHRVFDRNGATGSAYGGLNIRPGQPAQPHIGFKAEREFKNGFVNGFGQVQRGPGGRPSPSFGVNGGFRFRRDAEEEMEQEQQY